MARRVKINPHVILRLELREDGALATACAPASSRSSTSMSRCSIISCSPSVPGQTGRT